MKFTTYDEIRDFLDTVETCKNDVYLQSQYGDVYNLKSRLSQYLGIAALLSEHGDELELFCANKEDEPKLLRYLSTHSEVLGIRSDLIKIA
ncbi:MAG: polya polymerase [Oscillospiraceae bacterium]|nr:polya polymerase [Oscillospiraceae bacterium]